MTRVRVGRTWHMAAENTACMGPRVRGTGTAGTSLCSSPRAWGRRGQVASRTLAPMQRPVIRSKASSVARRWHCLTTPSLSTSPTGRPTSPSCSGCKGHSRKVWLSVKRRRSVRVMLGQSAEWCVLTDWYLGLSRRRGTFSDKILWNTAKGCHYLPHLSSFQGYLDQVFTIDWLPRRYLAV